MSQLAAGNAVPDFALPATGDKTVSRQDLLGRWTVLYFYPKDNTPGCTQEGQDFRDLHPTFLELGATVYGVSRESLKSHDNFRCKQQFPFDLLSDSDETLCALFDVIKLKNMYGKQVRGIERSTFILDPEGRLAREWRKVSVKGHAAEVLEALKKLQAP
ncbi:MAG: peroxiredoxin [Methylococcaceae bacterium]|nr:peroxiredoxin [Methylococcaceae bacterium]